jgi:hypothetical protein
MREPTYPFLICTKCYEVNGWADPHCFDGRHAWVTANVTECPYMSLTATGRTTPPRVAAADRDCQASGDLGYESHHYGDRRRRHFTVPMARGVSPLMPHRVHVYPLNDEIEHDTDGDDCLCTPDIEEVEGGGIVVIHHSLDGREATEVVTDA